MNRCLLFLGVAALALYASPAHADDGFEGIVPAGAERAEDIGEAFEQAAGSAEIMRFQCRNGVFAGGDFDSALELSYDGTVKLIDYGFAVIEREGTLEIVAEDDELGPHLVVTFEDDREWPPMAVYIDGEDLVLIPASGTPDETYEHEGTPVAEYAITVWPYRLVRPEGE